LPEHVSARFPRWLFTGFTLVMSTALIMLWLGRIIPYTLAGRFPDELAGLTTLVTHAFDMGMVVPLLLSTAILLWRRSGWGYILSAISVTFGFFFTRDRSTSLKPLRLFCCAWWASLWPGGFSGVCKRERRAQVAKWRPYDGCGPTLQPELDGRVVNGKSSFPQHLLEVAVAK
jgi:hypothetical protein